MITNDILEYERTGTHKGENGTALVIAGSEDYAGAAVLTATACEAILRSGADLAIACCPERVAWLVNDRLPDAITKKYNTNHFTQDHTEAILDQAHDADVTLIGPGLTPDAQPFAHDVLTHLDTPAVIDADAINAVTINDVEHSVFTPHEEEYNNLLTGSNADENIDERLGTNIILKKGVTDEIISEDQREENTTGNAGMTKGGTGDVLAGLTAGFIAQGRSLFKSACAAAYLNGAVADYLQEERNTTYIASDIVHNIHNVI